VARSLLELRTTPPREWTVARTAQASDPYLVCPSCRHRAQLQDGRATTLRCPRCNELFAIAWDDGSVKPSREELRPDHRMTRRRRMSRDRRTGQERRGVERRTLSVAVSFERRVAERRAIAERRSGLDRRGSADRRRRATAW